MMHSLYLNFCLTLTLYDTFFCILIVWLKPVSYRTKKPHLTRALHDVPRVITDLIACLLAGWLALDGPGRAWCGVNHGEDSKIIPFGRDGGGGRGVGVLTHFAGTRGALISSEAPGTSAYPAYRKRLNKAVSTAGLGLGLRHARQEQEREQGRAELEHGS